MAAELGAVVCDVVALQGLERDDDQLVGGGLFVGRELCADFGFERQGKNAGFIHHAAGEHGKRRSGDGACAEELKSNEGQQQE